MAESDLYNSWRHVPQNAQKEIKGGNLNGKTDINPQWRIQVLTERFGPVGFGWTTKIVEHWSDTEVIQGVTERVAWVRVELRINYGGKWSEPIEGIGGSKYAGKGRGSELNDEAFKMAETDAISVACKKLGIGADIYWNTTNTKYTQTGQQSQPQQQQRQRQPDYRLITLDERDRPLRDWLVQCAAQGYTREQCELTANQAYKVTIPTALWQKIMEEAI